MPNVINRAILTPQNFSRQVYFWVPASLAASASVFIIKNPAATPQQPCEIRFRTAGLIDIRVQDGSIPVTGDIEWKSYVGKYARCDMQYQWDPATGISQCWAYFYFDYNFENTMPTTSLYSGEFVADEPVTLASSGLSFELERGWWSLVFPPPYNFTEPLVSLWPGYGPWAGDVTQTTAEVSYYGESYPSGATSVPISGADLIGMKTATNFAMSTGVVTYSGAPRNAAGWRKFAVTGLTAGSTYYHQMTVNGTLVGQVSKFKTLQTANVACTTKLAVYSCTRDNPSSAAVATDMATFAPNRAIMLGDRGYPNDLSDSPTALTHERNWALQVTDPSSMAVQSLCAEEYIISDHDVNGTGASNRPNFNDPITAENLVEWAAVVPARMVDARTPKRARYRSYIEGHVRYILLDTRSLDKTDRAGSSDLNSTSATMLGLTQLNWLKAEIDAASLAGQFCAIFSDPAWNGTLVEGDGLTDGKIAVSYSDKWPAYPYERDLISDYIKASYLAHGKGMNAAKFSGDTHAMQQDDGTHEKNGMRAFVCGPFHQRVHAHFMSSYDRTFPLNADAPGALPYKMMYQQVTFAEAPAGTLTMTVVGRNCTPNDSGTPLTPSGMNPTPYVYTL